MGICVETPWYLSLRYSLESKEDLFTVDRESSENKQEIFIWISPNIHIMNSHLTEDQS